MVSSDFITTYTISLFDNYLHTFFQKHFRSFVALKATQLLHDKQFVAWYISKTNNYISGVNTIHYLKIHLSR